MTAIKSISATAGEISWSAVPWLTLAVAVSVVAVFIIPGAGSALEYDRGTIAHGELWRAVTGHITHFDRNHLAWDLVTFLALGILTERASRFRTAATLLAASVAISTALWYLQPEFQIYRGLSGLDCALGGLVAADLLLQRRWEARISGALIFCFVAGKCLYETTAPRPLFAQGGTYESVPLGHLIGLTVGAAIALLSPLIFRRQTRD